MFSPTGYWANVSVTGHDCNYNDCRPILHWNGDGRPIVADEDGNLVTAQQWKEGFDEIREEGDGITISLSIDITPCGE